MPHHSALESAGFERASSHRVRPQRHRGEFALREQEWRECGDPAAMLRFVTQRAWSGKERLFACACGWQVVCHPTDPLVLAALYVAERFADNLVDTDEVVCAFEVAHEAGNENE